MRGAADHFQLDRRVDLLLPDVLGRFNLGVEAVGITDRSAWGANERVDRRKHGWQVVALDGVDRSEHIAGRIDISIMPEDAQMVEVMDVAEALALRLSQPR